ncbi:hybrid sensor histidine kinase/response regulator [Heliorestis convoluta]|nr:ATP-binding protein [Heliorestis convoluta]
MEIEKKSYSFTPEELLHTITDNMLDMLFVTDNHFMIQFATPSFEKGLGVKTADIEGTSIFERVHPEDLPYVQRKVKEALKGEGQGTAIFRYRHGAGHYIWNEARGKVLYNNKGQITGAVFTNRDITERKKVQECLADQAKDLEIALKKAESATKELIQSDHNKNQFLSSLSHELRNPLASITMSISMLKRVASDSEQAKQAQAILERQTMQLSRLVDDLLDVTRISQNKIELKKEFVELNGLVLKAVEDYKPMFYEKEVSLEVHNSSDPMYLQADSARITQVVGNLLHNALKFTEKGHSVQVVVLKNEESKEAEIEVRDNGQGIKKELLPEILKPFVQAEVSLDRIHGGLGMGLSIVKGIVELHGGRVSVHSLGLGKGSQIKISVPIPQEKENNEEKNTPKIEKSLSPMKIMVIEDIADVAEILCSLLQLLGHTVTSVSDGSQGLEELKKFNPDVVLCDIGLPGMTGFEVAQAIRANPAFKEIFLIALSGYAQEEDKERAMKAGFDLHLAKPVDLDHLEQILSKVKASAREIS